MLPKPRNGLMGLTLLAVLLLTPVAGCTSSSVAPAPSAVVVTATPGATAEPTMVTAVLEPSASPALKPGVSPEPATAILPVATTAPPETVTPPASPAPVTPIPAATTTPQAVKSAASQALALGTTASSSAVPITPTGGLQVAPVFASVQHDYTRPFMGVVRHNSLGAPVEAAHDTKVALQSFGAYSPRGICDSKDSLMLWREDQRQIYFLVVENSGLHWDECPDYWKVFADTWQPGDPNNEDIVAPEGKIVPRGGFGKVWRQNFYGQEGPELGFPSAPERYTAATVQRFEHGTAFRFAGDGSTYVLFDEFHFVTRGGESTGRIWFKNY